MNTQSIKENKIVQYYLQHRFVINCAIISLLCLMHCFWSGMMFFIYPILLALVLLDRLEDGLSYILFMLPFAFLSLFLSIILYFVCIVAYIIKVYCHIYIIEKQKPSILVLVMLGIFYIYSLLPFGPYDLNLALRIGLLTFVFAVLGAAIRRPDLLRLKHNLRVFSIAVLISAAFGLCYFISPYLQSYLVIVPLTGKLFRYQALLSHPNLFAIFCEIICALYAYYIISKQCKLYDYVLFGAITLLGFTTFSKTYLILIGVVYFSIFVWFLKRDFVKTMTFAMLVAIVFVLICSLDFGLAITYINRFIGSFVTCKTVVDFLNVITTLRYELWAAYLVFLWQHPLALIFGKGLGAKALVTSQVLSAHNLFISMVYQLGLVGSAIFISIIVLMVRISFKKCTVKPHKAIWVPIIVIFLLFCVEDLIFFIFK